MADTKRCVLCDSEISEKATFCKECNHHQGKFRYFLDFGNTTLALLIAFASVIGFLIPVVQAYYKPTDSIIRVEPFRYNPDFGDKQLANVEFYLKNLGDKPALIGFCKTSFPDHPDEKQKNLKPDANIENAIVNPGETRLVKLQIPFKNILTDQARDDFRKKKNIKSAFGELFAWYENPVIELKIINYQGSEDYYKFEVTPLNPRVESEAKDIHASHIWNVAK